MTDNLPVAVDQPEPTTIAREHRGRVTIQEPHTTTEWITSRISYSRTDTGEDRDSRMAAQLGDFKRDSDDEDEDGGWDNGWNWGEA